MPVVAVTCNPRMLQCFLPCAVCDILITCPVGKETGAYQHCAILWHWPYLFSSVRKHSGYRILKKVVLLGLSAITKRQMWELFATVDLHICLYKLWLSTTEVAYYWFDSFYDEMKSEKWIDWCKDCAVSYGSIHFLWNAISVVEMDVSDVTPECSQLNFCIQRLKGNCILWLASLPRESSSLYHTCLVE